MQPLIKNIAGIESICAEKENAQTAVVFLHGYGANMRDLFPLMDMLDNGSYSWFFPNGVLSLSSSYYEGRAWFSIDMEALDRAIRTGEFRDLANRIPAEFDDTIHQLDHFLTELSKKYSKIIIGGFSQGAMCCSHLAMKTNLPLSGLILLSGNMIAMDRFPASAKGLPFYQSHGTRDPILPLAGAKALEERLHSLNFQGRLSVFEGGHEIPMNVINEVKIFLETL